MPFVQELVRTYIFYLILVPETRVVSGERTWNGTRRMTLSIAQLIV